MTDYTQNQNYTAKDALSSGDPEKIIRGSDIDSEFSEISTAIATKTNKVSGSPISGYIATFDTGGDLVLSSVSASDITELESNKANKVSGSPISGYIATFDSEGDLTTGTYLDEDLVRINQTRKTKNAILNGNFDIWQRGTSFTLSDSAYVADRFRFSAAGTISASINRFQFVQGTTEVPDEPNYYMRTNVTSASGGASWEIITRLEDVRLYAGKTATLSFYVRSGSNRSDFKVRALQVYQSSPTNSIEIYSDATIDVTTDWTKVTRTFDVPLTSNAGSPTAIDEDTSSFQFSFGFDGANIVEFFDISHIQFEEGDTATSFEYVKPSETLHQCQRYFTKTYLYDVTPGTSGQHDIGTPHFEGVATSAAAGWAPFPVRMRSTPTVVIYAPSAGLSNAIETTSQSLVGSPGEGAVTAVEVGETGIGQVYVPGELTAGTHYQFHYTAEAEL